MLTLQRKLFMESIYCPYTDKEISLEQSNNEHIIPKSLGGINSFNLPVDATYNSKAGSEIDGELANDLFILFRRREYDARGHSNKPPKILSKKSFFKDNKKPLQVEFKGEEGIKVWDSIERKELDPQDIVGKTITSSFTFSRYGRARFAAKVALATGYFIYGELFREAVKHEDLRKLMNFSEQSIKEDFENVSLRIYDQFMPTEKQEDEEDRDLYNFFCDFIGSSCVIIIPGPTNLAFVVGILGQHIATLNVEANTDDFPLDEDFDLGHVIILKDDQLERISYRELALRVKEKLDSESNKTS